MRNETSHRFTENDQVYRERQQHLDSAPGRGAWDREDEDADEDLDKGRVVEALDDALRLEEERLGHAPRGGRVGDFGQVLHHLVAVGLRAGVDVVGAPCGRRSAVSSVAHGEHDLTAADGKSDSYQS